MVYLPYQARETTARRHVAERGRKGLNQRFPKWEFYDALLREVPEDARVSDVCVGLYRTYVEAEYPDGRRSLGTSYTMTGGGMSLTDGLLTGRSLREVCALAKSWNWRESSIGVAALNAWYSTRERVEALGGFFADPRELSATDEGGTICTPHTSGKLVYRVEKTDPFFFLREEFAGKKVTVVGHFPWLEKIAEVAELTVLERDPSEADGDTPDPACEYVIPDADFVIMTAVTVINKTAPRLIELAQDAVCAIVGPSVTAAQQIFDYGVDILAGRVVTDPERAKTAVKQDLSFGSSLQMFAIDKRRR